MALSKAGNFEEFARVKNIIPTAKKSAIPEHIPENVVRPLYEAETSFMDGRYSAAGACYRKAIERALKSLAPDVDGMLNQRIRHLEKKQIIPQTLVDLLDQVRLFGNEAMHEDELDPNKQDCSAARDFCQLFLTYAFTLPANIADAKAKATENSSS